MAAHKASLNSLGRRVDEAVAKRDLDAIQTCIDEIKIEAEMPQEERRKGTWYYFLANAYSGRRSIRTSGKPLEFWEDEDLEAEIFYLRNSLRFFGPHQSSEQKIRACQVHTNLGNSLNFVGRPIEALHHWDSALSILPFGMARGNRGLGLFYYAQCAPDRSHGQVIARVASHDLSLAIEQAEELEPGAAKVFSGSLARIKKMLGDSYKVQPELDTYPLGESKDEQQYRRWCLGHRLFLNPLNDLGSHTIASTDVLHLPTFTSSIDEGPWPLSFFNQLKQEYVSARFLLYEGIHQKGLHFSDKQVAIVDTLDCSSHTLQSQKILVAFRSLYSLFDKIAFFVNEYFQVGVQPKYVSMKTIWYLDRQKEKGINPYFIDLANNPLRGLFWLAKDLSENRPGFIDALEPEAQEIETLRQHAEHRYLKLVEVVHERKQLPSDPMSCIEDRRSKIQGRRAFISKALRVAQLSRSGLVYLAMAVRSHEILKKSAEDEKDNFMPVTLGHLPDEMRIWP